MSTKVSTRNPTDADRLAVRHCPDGLPVMHQDWGDLLFIHWRVSENAIRHLVPSALNIDLYGDSAWIGITPFRMWDVRPFPPLAPAIPGVDSMYELNVRTYVHYDGVPGVWFFSLDIDSVLAATAARMAFHLPYHHAEIEFKEDDGEFDFSLDRTGEVPAQVRASWRVGERLPVSQPGTREFFLTERYCLFTEDCGEIFRSRIHHQPWPLHSAELTSFETNIFEAHRLPVPETHPLVHYADEVNVDIWYLEQVGSQ